MKIKVTVELEQEIPDADVIEVFYKRALANDFKDIKKGIIEDLKDDDWDKVNILEFSVEDINPSKFHSNKPMK